MFKNNLIFNRCKIVLCLYLLIALQNVNAEIKDPRATASFYIDTYGLVDVSASHLFRRANTIFKRLQQVAEEPVGINPVLKIVNSKGRPWAIALPDGYVILSKAAIDICYNQVDEQVGDARLAFVIGHELAHLTSKDFWHQNIYLSLSSGQKSNIDLDKIRDAFNIDDSEKLEDWRNIVKTKELHADDEGFTYASLANFRTDLLFAENKKRDDFLTTWIRQTRNIEDDLHFNAKDRTAFLMNRFKQMTSKIEYFMSGVRLSHFGQYEDAMHFFKTFQRAFPAHEVLNNMGFVQLQLARKHMPNSLRYRYWLPSFLDNMPNLVALTRSMGQILPERSRQHLDNAVDYLKRSSNMHLANVNSRINLAISYLYLDKYHKARAILEEARVLEPNNPIIKELRAIIIYEQEKDIDMWPMAVKILKTLNESPTSLFNLARLYENRGRFEQAKIVWTKLIGLRNQLPKSIFAIACQKTDKPTKCLKSYRGKNVSPPFRTRLEFGESLDTAKAKNILKSWKHRQENIGPLPVDLFYSENADLYLALDNKISMVVVKEHSHKSIKGLLKCCGIPISKQNLGQWELWSYGTKWSALIEENKVREYWINGS